MFLAQLYSYAFTLFLITSPLTSYVDTILSIRRLKTSAGFSIDLCGINLVANLLRINFWIGKRYEWSLLVQSIVMVVTQLFLLQACLEYRPIRLKTQESERPFNLWQWSNRNTYWHSLLRLVAALFVLQYLFGRYPLYVDLLGTVALGIEATLPIPQFLSNLRHRSVQGVRLSMLGSWLLGDFGKMIFFYAGTSTNVSLQFKLCALVQTVFDSCIGVQYLLWRDKPPAVLDMDMSLPSLDLANSKGSLLPL
ncbi:hypothetical protein BCR37DRAFT_350016 [Protomyces lactucae-debilis]|uniref:PQ loop repeat-domain-containing protein n=1 Tax=Protomyces lactucae-debilis TaxID=2754530 RepID=A0A1Y2F5A5_PROLT|nr:uncharacterized protein BCR37DRAFT_350016 [Protomyces lactucae-debilis]ORY79033.1 hypothetical protein BCR37DRAFT_350016 [Protomyces lactucae-debilis]